MCIKEWVCILPGVLVPGRQDWISLKLIWHMTSNKTQVEFKEGGCLPIWKLYLSLVHGMLMLLMFS